MFDSLDPMVLLHVYIFMENLILSLNIIKICPL